MVSSLRPGEPRQGRETSTLRLWAGEWKGAGEAGEEDVSSGRQAQAGLPGRGRKWIRPLGIPSTPYSASQELVLAVWCLHWASSHNLAISRLFSSGLVDAFTFQDP